MLSNLTAARKRFPSNFSRDLRCPTMYTNFSGFTPEQVPKDIKFDTSLKGVVNDDVVVVVILVRRGADGSVRYKYLSNGYENVPAETWSSSKIIAATNGGKIRTNRRT